MTSVELLIKEKLKAALDGQKKSIASGLLSTPTEPPIPAQGPMVVNPVEDYGGAGSVSSSTWGEAFSPTGRPVSAAPSPGLGERRKRLVNKVQKQNIKLHDLQQQRTHSHDARGLGLKQRAAQTERSLALQKLAMAR